ncbi:MAG: HD domain-containing protein [Nitrospira sp.]
MIWYRDAEAELSTIAAAVQTQSPVQLGRLTALAGQLVASLKRSDELIVMALSNPAGSPLMTNLLNVAVVSTKIGLGLGYYGRELERLALAGLIHDIGLFAVPQSLLTKAGRLTQDERKLIEQHPELGYDVVERAGSEFVWLAQLVRQAHERINGQGYPNRLKGRQISEMAQIIGVADVFDALVSERPYRRRLFPHEAIKELLIVERATFPREIVKALVEQLSVYPLGTTVRLTTGETGIVVGVNAKYPLRPVVQIEDRDDGEIHRQVDLSLTPLVAVVEALNPPVVGRVMFTEEPSTSPAQTEFVPGAASDQFTSLLESLDAIATAIQGVVEHKLHAAFGQDHNTLRLREAGAVGTDVDAGLDKEVIGLFALEAREWLAQIESALAQLRTGEEGAVRSHIYGILLNGITNLAKSASTVQLSEIEAMATNLLPILRDVGGAQQAIAGESLRQLQNGLDRIVSAVHRLASIPAEGLMAAAQLPEGDRQVEPAEAASLGSEVEVPESRPASWTRPNRQGAGLPLLSALRELQKVRSRSVQPARDMLEAVIQRAGDVGVAEQSVDTSVIERILRDLDRLDEEFLREVHSRVPEMTDRLTVLRSQSADFVTASQLDPILANVEFLHDQAKSVHALTITMFLQGLKTFLTATAYRKVASLPHRLEALAMRLTTLVPMAEQWVNLGRIERAAIKDILPA